MNNQEILERAKDIDAIMNGNHFMDMGFDSKESCNGFNLDKYHTDWNWTMNAVQQINYMDNYQYTVKIGSMDCEVYDQKGKTIAKCEGKYDPDQLILSLFETISNFAKWYRGNALRLQAKQIQERIGENAKIIAEFMGAVEHLNEYDLFTTTLLGDIFENLENKPEEQHFFKPEEMQFHNSWEWLMPVIFHIKQHTDFNVEIASDYIGRFRIVHKQDPNIYDQELVSGTAINSAYQVVVDFLKWRKEKQYVDKYLPYSIQVDFKTDGDYEDEYPIFKSKMESLFKFMPFGNVRGYYDTSKGVFLSFNDKMTIKGGFDSDPFMVDFTYMGKTHKIDIHPFDTMGGFDKEKFESSLRKIVKKR